MPKNLVGILYLLQQHPKLFHVSNTPSVPQTHNELVGLASGNYAHFNHTRGEVIAHTTILSKAMDSPKKILYSRMTNALLRAPATRINLIHCAIWTGASKSRFELICPFLVKFSDEKLDLTLDLSKQQRKIISNSRASKDSDESQSDPESEPPNLSDSSSDEFSDPE